MDQLIAGYRNFRDTEWPRQRPIFEALARDGQSPRALVIACSDSRVDPSLIFSAHPGELFVVRNVANLIPEYHPDSSFHCTSAAVEFAVRVLEVPDLIVLGHRGCGGIRALLNGAPDHAGDFLPQWMQIAAPARDRVLACAPVNPQGACEEAAIRLSLDNLRTFPWIAERVAAGALRLHGVLFDISEGVLELMRPNGAFETV